MNIIEKTIAAISPSWAASRLQNKAKIMAYEAATSSRTHKANRESRSANESVFLAGASLREQARWLDENHDLAIGILDKLEERVIGSRGVMIEPQPLNKKGDVHEAFAEQISRAWAEWSLRPEVTGTLSRPEMERMVFRSAVRDGEVFGQMVRGRAIGLNYPTAVSFAIECLEADFVPLSMNEAANNVRQGIKVNAWGRPSEFGVLYQHPGETVSMWGKVKWVPAESMLHLAHRKRLHQLRGISIFHGVIQRLADIKDYEEAERVAARIAACLGFYIKRGDQYFDPPAGEKQEQREFAISPGFTIDNLRPGEDIGMIESNRPNVHLYEFRNGQMRAVSAGTRSSYSSVSRDYNGSYSSQRQELVESQEGFAVLQDWFVSQWARPVYREWLKMYLLTVTPPADVDVNSIFNAMYMAPKMPWINPQHEAVSWRTLVRGGAATEAEWIRARGGNPREVKRQRKAEIDYNNSNGLVFDSDASKVSNAGVQHAHLEQFDGPTGNENG